MQFWECYFLGYLVRLVGDSLKRILAPLRFGVTCPRLSVKDGRRQEKQQHQKSDV